MCWLVQMLKILYLFFIRASVVRLSLIPEVSEGLELLLLGRRSHLQLYNSPSIIWAEMGEGEDERPPNFDEILEMTGLDPDQVSMSHIWELSFLFIYLPRSSVLHSLGFIRTVWMSLNGWFCWLASSSVRYNENEITQVFKLSVTRSGTNWIITALYLTAIKVVN